MLAFTMMLAPNVLDGPYRPKPPPAPGRLYPFAKVLVTTVMVGLAGGVAAWVVYW